ncbi:TetR/AcrR family transcriptional regulator [Leifsonia poae]|uniref:TetR/AcrR family transcriptional regulator n=1 Tax=Leifsonia poae TaxID=110933 RepID=UPI001CBCAA62|nr:TetR/AcrR family transcriptional regulator [Leifsonia poae]
MAASRPTRRSGAAADRVVKPQARTAATRQRILDSAMAVFAIRGFNNGSLIEIAEQAGMTHAGVLHHFGSKDQLLIAVLEHRDQADVMHLEGQHPPVGKDLLRHLVDTARLNATRAGIVQAYAVLSAESVTDDHPAQDFFRERFIGLRSMVAEAFREVAPADVAEEKLWQAAAAVIAVMDGLQVQWLLEPDAVQMPESVDAVIGALTAWLNA